MRKKRQNSKASQRRKAVPPTNKANPITGQERANQSKDQALAKEVEGSLGLYLEDIFQKVVEIEEEALASKDEDES